MEYLKRTKGTQKFNMHFPKQKIGIQRTRLVTLPSDHSLILKTSLEKTEYLKRTKGTQKFNMHFPKQKIGIQRTDLVTLQLTTHPYFCLTFVINLFKSCMDSHFPSNYEKNRGGNKSSPSSQQRTIFRNQVKCEQNIYH